jgi:hypothetical protein
MPVWHVAIINNEGHIFDFSFNEKLSPRNNFEDFSEQKLPINFGFSYEKHLYIIPENTDFVMSRIWQKDGTVEQVPSSKIPSWHDRHGFGVQIGNKYWVLGGFDFPRCDLNGIEEDCGKFEFSRLFSNKFPTTLSRFKMSVLNFPPHLV